MVDDLVEQLETTPAGPDLAVLLATVDRSALDGSGVITLAQARARLIAHEQAQLLADVAELGLVDWHTPEGVLARMGAPDEFSVDRIAWALRWSREAAQVQLLLAADLIHRLPAVYAALRCGDIDLARARVFHEVLLGVDDEVAQAVVAKLISQAPGWTCGRLRERLRYHLHKTDPGYAARRYQRAVTNRQVRGGSSPDGTAYLSGTDLPIDRAAAADDHLTRLARAAKAAGDPRTLAQLRADAYLDLLTGIAFRARPSRDPTTHAADEQDRLGEAALHQQWATAAKHPNPPNPESQVDSAGEAQRWVPASEVVDGDDSPVGTAAFASAPDVTIGYPPQDQPLDARRCCTCGGLRPADRRGVVTLTMTLQTLTGLADDPAILPTWGPVLAEIARHVALDQHTKPSWQFAVTDDHGRLLHSGPIRRRPHAADLRHTRLRDRTCRAPNCRRPATTCDTDHRRSHASGGSSEAVNLDTLCRHHHRLKQEKNLRIRALNTGAYRWHAPNGQHWDVPADHDYPH